jgi:hypothetical protein
MLIHDSVRAIALTLVLGLASRAAVGQEAEPAAAQPAAAEPEPVRLAPAPIAAAPTSVLAVPEPAIPARSGRPAPAYRLRLGIELPVIGALAVVTVTRLFKAGRASCAPLCDRNDVNPIDRVTAGYYDTRWQRAADAGLYGIIAGAAAVLTADEGVLNALSDATVVTESILAAAALSSMLTLQVGRPRPLLYSEKAPLARRNGADAAMSFLSGHVAVSFAAATSTFMTLHRLHPRAAGPWIVLGVGSLLATSVAVGRTMGGNHFISDNALGALAGVSTGILFPSLHDSGVEVVPLAGAGQRGMAVQAGF